MEVVDMGRDRFPRFNGIDCSAVGDGKNATVGRFLRKAHGLADRTAFSGRNSRKRRLDGKHLCAPSRSLGGANQSYVLPWPDTRALFTMQAAEAKVTLLCMHCQCMEPLAPRQMVRPIEMYSQ